MGGGGGKGSSGSGDSTVRFAPYVEDAHSALIGSSNAEMATALAGTNPFSALSFDNIDTAFFSTGYTIASFPSLWDMFGKFMAGLDIEALWAQLYENTVNSPALDATITAESVLLQNDIDNTAMPKIKAGYRDINAVMSTSFVTAATLIQSQKLKTMAKYSADVKLHGMDVAVGRWGKHLEWNGHVVEQYKLMNQIFWQTKLEYVKASGNLAVDIALWRLNVLAQHRANVQALNGATASHVKNTSPVGNAISGAMGGAAMGGLLGGMIPAVGAGVIGSGVAAGATMGLPGMLIGGALGLAAGLFS